MCVLLFLSTNGRAISVVNLLQLFRRCQDDVREMGRLLVQGVPPEKRKLRGNMQKSMATQLTKLSQDFRLQQKLYLQGVQNAPPSL